MSALRDHLQLCLGHRDSIDVLVRRLLHEVADLDALHPRLLDDVVDQRPHLGVWLEHLANHWPTRARGEVVDRGRAGRLRGGIARGNIGREELISRLRHSPRELLEVQAVVDDAACPDVHQSSVIG